MNNSLYRIELKSMNIRYTNLIGPFILLVTLVSSLFFTQTVIAQKVLVQTGFEEFTVGDPPADWVVAKGDQMQVTDATVKTDNKALGILGGANDDSIGVAIDTENPIITVECWVYIKGAGRSFNLKVVSNENITVNDGGVYINWNANAVRLYNGSAWVPIDDFQFDAWKYIRVVADVSKSTFDYYVGDDVDTARATDPKTGLAFRKAATNPVAQWVAFHVYSSVAQGFVDDLLIYEGSNPPSVTPVEPNGKLATYWGNVKKSTLMR